MQSNPKRKFSTIRLEYFANLEYFWNISQCDILILTDHFTYSKNTITTTSAPMNDLNINLKIPVVHDKEKNLIFRKNISYRSDWTKEHVLTLKHQYKNKPFAYMYYPILYQLLNKKEVNLSKFLTDQIMLIADWLKFNIQIELASDIGFEDDNNQTIINWHKHLGCNEYINSSSVFERGFVDKTLLKQQHIAVYNFSNLPNINIFEYYKDLSILSFLFQFGPEAGYLIRQFMPVP